jgi:hypothetical protein
MILYAAEEFSVVIPNPIQRVRNLSRISNRREIPHFAWPPEGGIGMTMKGASSGARKEIVGQIIGEMIEIMTGNLP